MKNAMAIWCCMFVFVLTWLAFAQDRPATESEITKDNMTPTQIREYSEAQSYKYRLAGDFAEIMENTESREAAGRDERTSEDQANVDAGKDALDKEDWEILINMIKSPVSPNDYEEQHEALSDLKDALIAKGYKQL